MLDMLLDLINYIDKFLVFTCSDYLCGPFVQVPCCYGVFFLRMTP